MTSSAGAAEAKPRPATISARDPLSRAAEIDDGPCALLCISRAGELLLHRPFFALFARSLSAVCWPNTAFCIFPSAVWSPFTALFWARPPASLGRPCSEVHSSSPAAIHEPKSSVGSAGCVARRGRMSGQTFMLRSAPPRSTARPLAYPSEARVRRSSPAPGTALSPRGCGPGPARCQGPRPPVGR